METIFDPLLGVGSERADRALERRLLCYGVVAGPGPDLPYGEHRRAERIDVPTHDRLQAVDDLVGHRYGVDCLMWFARVSALTLDRHLEAVGGTVIGPRRTPTCPAGSSGHTCCAKMTRGRCSLNTPSRIIRRAPPAGEASSAGWNRRSTRPGISSLTSSSNHPAPTSIAVWASCPQACIIPSTFETKEWSFSSCMGNASMSALKATVSPRLPPSTTPSTPVLA